MGLPVSHIYVCCYLILVDSLCFSTSTISIAGIRITQDMRLNVSPRDVITAQSSIHCIVMCQATSWCLSANLSPDKRTCQLMSEEVTDVSSLESAEGWKYISKY